MNHGNKIQIFVPMSHYNIVEKKVEGSETVDNSFKTTIELYNSMIIEYKRQKMFVYIM
jgi:hypothetical protein